MAKPQGPLWTGDGVDMRVSGRGGALTGSRPPATPEHRSSPTESEKREGNTGVLLWASPELGWQCGNRAMAEEELSGASTKLGGRGKRGWRCGEKR
jgi:hypothetical protein